MNTFFAQENSILTGNYSKPFGMGFECELAQRAAKAQIIKYLPELTAQLQGIWDNRDKEFEEFMGEAHKKILIPKVEKENIRAGIECMSLIDAPLSRWPSILIYSRNGTPYQYQEDQFDTESFALNIEILCKSAGSVKEKEVHNKEGLEMMELLDSEIQRLTDSVYLCIQKDPTLSGSIGQIEKPPKIATSLPWARKESETATGETYILQGKQLDFTVQRISL